MTGPFSKGTLATRAGLEFCRRTILEFSEPWFRLRWTSPCPDATAHLLPDASVAYFPLGPHLRFSCLSDFSRFE